MSLIETEEIKDPKEVWDKNVKRFFATAYLRHRIYALKEFGVPKPWTSNKVFQASYFCNVFRDMDKTSKWMIENIIHPNEENHQLWWYLMIARYISRFDLFNLMKKEIDYPNVSRNRLKHYLWDRHEEGKPIVTNAFIVNSKVKGGYSDKINYMFNMLTCVEDELGDVDEYLRKCERLEDVYYILMKVPGIGPFMAYQYTIDFSYSNRYLKNAEDKDTWTSLGLGAKRGLSRINYDVPNQNVAEPLKQAKAILELWKWHVAENIDNELEWVEQELEKHDIKINMDNEYMMHMLIKIYSRFSNLTMCDVQHWLCEYDKYCRGGSKKRKYPGV